MRKIILILSASCLLSGLLNAQMFEKVDLGCLGFTSTKKPGKIINAGDYDNDGDYDILFVRNLIHNYYTRSFFLYRCDTIFEYNENIFRATDSLYDGYYSYADWGDFNNDGHLDFFLVGDSIPFFEIYYYYSTDKFKPTHDPLPKLMHAYANWADMNNDGLLDIITSGYLLDTNYLDIFINNGNNFSKWHDTSLMKTENPVEIASGDLDNDGDIDIIFHDCGILYILKNDSNKFTIKQAYTIDSSATLNNTGGPVALGDYNDDGKLDIFLNTNYDTTLYVYRNDDSLNFTKMLSLNGEVMARIELGDINNDGYLDIYLGTYNSDKSGGSTNGYLYIRDVDTALYSDSTSADYHLGQINRIPALADLDQDGDLDIYLYLYDNDCDSWDFFHRIYKNITDTINLPPTAPTGLYFEQDSNTITLNWAPSLDDHTQQNSISYNVYIGTQKDTIDIVSPMSDISNGFRRITSLGNAQLNNFYKIKDLDCGTYYWSVQAIDNAFLGSSFAQVDSFHVKCLSVFSVSDTIINYNIAVDNYDTLEVHYEGEASDTAAYIWNFDDGIIHSGIGSGPYKIVYKTPGYKTISLVVNEPGFKPDTSQQTILANESSYISSNFTLSSLVLCCFTNNEYDSIKVTYKGNAKDTADYYWDFDGGTILSGSGQGPYTIHWSTAGTRTVSLYVSQNGFTSDTTEKTILLSTALNIDLGDDQTIFYGDKTTLNANVTGGTAPYEYLWSNDSTRSSTIVRPLDTSTYSVIVTDTFGCWATNFVTIYLKYTENIVDKICLVTVDTATYKNIVVWEKIQGLGTNYYNIYKESTVKDVYTVIGTVPYDNPSIFIDTASSPEQHFDRYRISAVDFYGTESELSDYHQTIHLSANKGAYPNYVNLYWTDYVGFDYSTYYIYKGPTRGNLELLTSLSSDHNTYTDISSDTTILAYYQVGVKKASACIILKKKSAMEEPYTQSVSNMEDNRKLKPDPHDIHNPTILPNLYIYPNPAKEELNIDYYLTKPADIAIEIYNVLGEKVYVQRQENKNSGWHNNKITGSDFNVQPGLYNINVKAGNYSIYKRIVIE